VYHNRAEAREPAEERLVRRDVWKLFRASRLRQASSLTWTEKPHNESNDAYHKQFGSSSEYAATMVCWDEVRAINKRYRMIVEANLRLTQPFAKLRIRPELGAESANLAIHPTDLQMASK